MSDSVYTKLLEKYRPSTIKTFTLNLKRVLREGFEVTEYDISPLVDIKATKKYLNTVDKSGMRKTLVASIIAFLRVEPNIPDGLLKDYEKYFTTLAKKVNNERLYKEPTPEELSNWLPWSDVIAKRKKYKVYADCIEEYFLKKSTSKSTSKSVALEDKYTYMKYLLLCLYTYIPPLRGEEYLNAIVVSVSNPKLYQTIRDMTGRNLFDITHHKFVVYAYKTSGKYGTRIIDVPENVVDLVKKWTMITKAQLLLPVLSELPENEVPMLQESLTQMFFKIFEPKNISTSMLRKIYVSHRLKTLKDPEKRKALALTMGHSLVTQEFIYSTFRGLK